jgi:hypothetical protein
VISPLFAKRLKTWRNVDESSQEQA